MKDAGSALMGLGRASGDNRALDATRQAITSPLLEVNINGAQGILFNISGSSNLTLSEVWEAAEEIRSVADPEANIIFGTSFDERLADEVMITVIATGFDASRKREPVHAETRSQVPVGVRGARPDPLEFLREMDRQQRLNSPEPLVAVHRRLRHRPSPCCSFPRSRRCRRGMPARQPRSRRRDAGGRFQDRGPVAAKRGCRGRTDAVR
jgi:hypothetical protein